MCLVEAGQQVWRRSPMRPRRTSTARPPRTAQHHELMPCRRRCLIFHARLLEHLLLARRRCPWLLADLDRVLDLAASRVGRWPLAASLGRAPSSAPGREPLAASLAASPCLDLAAATRRRRGIPAVEGARVLREGGAVAFFMGLSSAQGGERHW
jgi:hypothetical protein